MSLVSDIKVEALAWADILHTLCMATLITAPCHFPSPLLNSVSRGSACMGSGLPMQVPNHLYAAMVQQRLEWRPKCNFIFRCCLDGDDFHNETINNCAATKALAIIILKLEILLY